MNSAATPRRSSLRVFAFLDPSMAESNRKVVEEGGLAKVVAVFESDVVGALLDPDLYTGHTRRWERNDA